MISIKNNRICPDCGKENILESNFCVACGKQLVKNINKSNINVVNKETDSSKKSGGNEWGILSLLFYFAGSTLVSYVISLLSSEIGERMSVLVGVCPLIGIVLMIIGRVKYPNNKFLKVVMWIIIGSIILGLIVSIVLAIIFVYLMVSCLNSCSNMDTGSCG